METTLSRVALENLRNIAQAVLEPSPGMNLLVGRNGAGKTSILEGIYLLANGKSFRRGAEKSLIQSGARQLRVSARLKGGDGDHQLKLVKSATLKQVEWDGEAIATISEAARRLPVLLLANDIVERFRAGCRGRQAIVDWGLFHVEPEFHGAWLRYRYLLRQRNEVLRQTRTAAASNWTKELIGAGEVVTRYRVDFGARVAACFTAIASDFGVGAEAACSFFQGWQESQPLESALAANWERDRRLGYTIAGPHRAEPKLTWLEQPVLSAGSTGQVKLLVYLLVLAVGRVIREARAAAPLVLIDDIGAALDDSALGSLVQWAHAQSGQSFVTDVTGTRVINQSHNRDLAVFHVEQGRIAA